MSINQSIKPRGKKNFPPTKNRGMHKLHTICAKTDDNEKQIVKYFKIGKV